MHSYRRVIVKSLKKKSTQEKGLEGKEGNEGVTFVVGKGDPKAATGQLLLWQLMLLVGVLG